MITLYLGFETTDSGFELTRIRVCDKSVFGFLITNSGFGVYALQWESTFLCKHIRVTRREVVTLLCSRLSWPDDPDTSTRLRLVQDLDWSWFGVLDTHGDGLISRKFVGIDFTPSDRRDFVRVSGPLENDTCLTAQILAFVTIAGFDNDTLALPRSMRHPPSNTHSVTLALVRWLSPHPNALIRDSHHRPIACSPLDINHAMWTFTTAHRNLLSVNTLFRHEHMYDGPDRQSRQALAMKERNAVFEFLEPETFVSYVNCTPVNFNQDMILETITLPFT